MKTNLEIETRKPTGIGVPPASGAPLPFKAVLFWAALAAAAFHLAYTFAGASFLIVLCLGALLQLTRARTGRIAFYSGLAMGLLIAGLHLTFFWRIFGARAIALWYVFAFWIALFVALGGLARRRFGPVWGVALLPFLWTGLEYFRSELYPLRFSWLNVGYAFADAPWQVPLKAFGMYGLGFVLMAVLCVGAIAWRKSAALGGAVGVVGLGVFFAWGWRSEIPKGLAPGATVRIAGVQMELPSETAVRFQLNNLLRRQPDTELVVLSEYTFTEPVPQTIKDWCRQNRRYLVVGAHDPLPEGNFYNTAFVIGPEGDIVFRQAKCMPIQFFKDGRPAPGQQLWNSPWGKIGICICYDLSFTRVTDELIRQGAEAILCPTVDVSDWGRRQHELHARVAPVRAAEYGVPIFRLASSGISQNVAASGGVLGTAPFDGEGAILAGRLALAGPGRLPLDRWLAPGAVGITGLAVLAFVTLHLFRAKTTPDSKLAEPRGGTGVAPVTNPGKMETGTTPIPRVPTPCHPS